MASPCRTRYSCPSAGTAEQIRFGALVAAAQPRPVGDIRARDAARRCAVRRLRADATGDRRPRHDRHVAGIHGRRAVATNAQDAAGDQPGRRQARAPRLRRAPPRARPRRRPVHHRGRDRRPGPRVTAARICSREGSATPSASSFTPSSSGCSTRPATASTDQRRTRSRTAASEATSVAACDLHLVTSVVESHEPVRLESKPSPRAQDSYRTDGHGFAEPEHRQRVATIAPVLVRDLSGRFLDRELESVAASDERLALSDEFLSLFARRAFLSPEFFEPVFKRRSPGLGIGPQGLGESQQRREFCA